MKDCQELSYKNIPILLHFQNHRASPGEYVDLPDQGPKDERSTLIAYTSILKKLYNTRHMQFSNT